MQDLAAMTDSSGDCFVENFSVGRVDYGCITFHGITNVSNMNIDDIVHIRRKEVHVYPDDSKKPPVGQGLNKPSEITLHRIWPTDKHTKMPISDPNTIISMSYDKKIERATIEMGAQFIDYDPVTGSWTFKVKHFSKYGLQDSDDEDEVDLNVANKRQTFKPLVVNNIKNTAASIMNTVDSIDRDLMTNDQSYTQLKEKDMIQRQMKLIEMRRLELMQRKSGQFKQQQQQENRPAHWEVINEYVPNKNVKKFVVDNSNLNLQLSSDSDSNNESEMEDDQQKIEKKSSTTLRKALIVDDENETDDEEENSSVDGNKENRNGLYPSLSGKKSKQYKSKMSDQLYPNLDSYASKYSDYNGI
jgi:hypothetical protein